MVLVIDIIHLVLLAPLLKLVETCLDHQISVLRGLTPFIKFVKKWAMLLLIVTIAWIMCIRGVILLNASLPWLLLTNLTLPNLGILTRVQLTTSPST